MLVFCALRILLYLSSFYEGLEAVPDRLFILLNMCGPSRVAPRCAHCHYCRCGRGKWREEGNWNDTRARPETGLMSLIFLVYTTTWSWVGIASHFVLV
ncbi:uncharacterized protein BJX67DRAFT_235767 [Aspergillus lucknowensis]|uniref:Secreted protein n=1 Tax=Aspergillus lucknowensis TaxID=176173 RepID=A0ABR4LI94_9EURO